MWQLLPYLSEKDGEVTQLLVTGVWRRTGGDWILFERIPRTRGPAQCLPLTRPRVEIPRGLARRVHFGVFDEEDPAAWTHSGRAAGPRHGAQPSGHCSRNG